MRRRLAVTVAVLGALVGEWLGHSLSYLRAAGITGLQAGLSGGVHDYMLPVGLLLLAAAAGGAALWMRAWLAWGRRLADAAAALARLRRGPPGPQRPDPRLLERPFAAAPWRRATFLSVAVALAAPMTLLQCCLYVVQENLERSVHGLAAPGLAPLLEGVGAAVWIQAATALLVSAALLGGLRLLDRRRSAVRRCHQAVRAMWTRRLRGTSSPAPRVADQLTKAPAHRGAQWCRPPPALNPG